MGVEIIETLQQIFVGNLTAALGALWPLLQGMWSAIIAIVISITCLKSATGNATSSTVSAAISAVFSLVLSGGVIRLLPELIESSIASAGDLAGIAGGDPPGAAPLAIAQAGVELFGMAANHASAQIGVMPWSFNLMGLIIYPTGAILFLAYLLIAFLVALALVELLVGAIVLSPAYAFLAVPGFSSVAFHPAGHLLSTVFRLSGLSFISAYGLATVQGTPLPDMGAEIGLVDCVSVIAIAGFLALAALFGDRVIIRSLHGTAGAFGSVGGNVANSISHAVSSGLGGGSSGRPSGAAGRNGSAGTGGGGGGQPGRMNTATWARRA